MKTDNLTLSEAQTWQARYRAGLLELAYKKEQGELAVLKDVERDVFNMARRVRDAILNIPDRISPELASTTDTHQVNVKLTRELIQALEELAA